MVNWGAIHTAVDIGLVGFRTALVLLDPKQQLFKYSLAELVMCYVGLWKG